MGLKENNHRIAGAVEYLSREARKGLVEVVISVQDKRIRRERAAAQKRGEKTSRGRPPVLKAVAGELGVSLPTVKAWRSGAWQSCNLNADRLLVRALDLDPSHALEILRNDFRRHEVAHQLIEEKYVGPPLIAEIPVIAEMYDEQTGEMEKINIVRDQDPES